MKSVIPLIITHGGAGAPFEWSDGCKKAAQAGYSLLKKGKDALSAVIESATVLEDDGRFNAGSGSTLRLDGKTIEMDASLMDSKGRIGVVAGVSGIKNPILLAREVMRTPHLILCGEGAMLFARRKGFKPYYFVSEKAKERYKKIKKAIRGRIAKDIPERWKGFNIKEIWNFNSSYEDILCDTVGAVARDKAGNFAVANSTGGASPMLKGRLGDSPMIGCGFYAGKFGAVATTGIGEEIIKKMLAKTVYDWIEKGISPKRACEKGISLFPKSVPIGIIAVSDKGYGVATNRNMPYYICDSDLRH